MQKIPLSRPQTAAILLQALDVSRVVLGHSRLDGFRYTEIRSALVAFAQKDPQRRRIS